MGKAGRGRGMGKRGAGKGADRSVSVWERDGGEAAGVAGIQKKSRRERRKRRERMENVSGKGGRRREVGRGVSEEGMEVAGEKHSGGRQPSRLNTRVGAFGSPSPRCRHKLLEANNERHSASLCKNPTLGWFDSLCVGRT